MTKYLYKVGETWWLKKPVPVDVQHAIGTKVLRYSLRTKDKRQADRNLLQELANLEQRFNRIRLENSKEAKEAQDYVRQVALRYDNPELAARASVDLAAVSQKAIEANLGTVTDPSHLERLAEEASRLATARGPDLSTVDGITEALKLVKATRQMHEANGFQLHILDTDGDAHAIFPEHLLPDVSSFIIARLKQEEAHLEALRAKFTGAASGASPEGLWALLQDWMKEQTPTPRTVLEAKTAIKRFEGENGILPVANITAEHVRRLKDALVGEGKSSATVNKQLGCLRALLNFAVRNGMLQINPFSGMRIIGKRDKKQRKDFSPSDLEALFAPIYKTKHVERYWIMKLAQYTGMRQSEICQLESSDVRKEDDVWVIAVGADDKPVKNQASRRIVPLHSFLIEDGFLDFVPQKGRLFPSVTPGSNGLAGSTFSKWFGRHIRKIGIVDKAKVFHSFRHTFKTLARQVMDPGYPDVLMGHAAKDVSTTYGRFTPRKLKEMIDRISFVS